MAVLLFFAYIFAPLPQVAAQALQVEVGRAIRGARGLARPYTPHGVPKAIVDTDAADTQATTTEVLQVVLTDASVHSRGPPEAAASTAERAIAVEPASNR